MSQRSKDQMSISKVDMIPCLRDGPLLGEFSIAGLVEVVDRLGAMLVQ